MIGDIVHNHGSRNGSELTKYAKSLPEIGEKEKYGLVNFERIRY